MTTLLEKAFSEAAKLPSQEQDSLANWILEMLESDAKWDALFENSTDALAHLAEEAVTEFHAGKCLPLHNLPNVTSWLRRSK